MSSNIADLKHLKELFPYNKQYEQKQPKIHNYQINSARVKFPSFHQTKAKLPLVLDNMKSRYIQQNPPNSNRLLQLNKLPKNNDSSMIMHHSPSYRQKNKSPNNNSPSSKFQSHNQNGQYQEEDSQKDLNLIEKYHDSPFLNYIFLQQPNKPRKQHDFQQYKSNYADRSNDNQPKDKDDIQFGKSLFLQQQEKSLFLDKSFRSQFGEDSPQFSSRKQMSKNMFNYHYVIGKGGFGKVWKVELKKGRIAFAMKEMSKAKIISKRSVNSVMSERNLLSQIKHPFLVNMIYSFQDRENLYLVMDLLTGGDLRFHVGKLRRFREVQTRFFVACILQALEYLHNNNIIHRDIKPENLVLDKDGYVRVTDLGIARPLRAENNQDTSGTPGYMAPEVMCRQNHGISVDYFALGVITYEFMMGRRPYLGRSRKEIRDLILAKQVQIKKHEIPEGWSMEAADFVNRVFLSQSNTIKLLQRKPHHRLGFNGPQEVINHPWIKSFPWKKLLNKELEAPFIPNSIEDNYDYIQQISNDDETNQSLQGQNQIMLRRNSVQSNSLDQIFFNDICIILDLFAGYNCDNTNKNQNIIGGITRSTNATTYNTQNLITNSNHQQELINQFNINAIHQLQQSQQLNSHHVSSVQFIDPNQCDSPYLNK